jgi:hypothetical protein
MNLIYKPSLPQRTNSAPRRTRPTVLYPLDYSVCTLGAVGHVVS